MSITKMIAKWRKGCFLSGNNPVNCLRCTEKLINDIEEYCNVIPKLDEAFMQALDRLVLAQPLPLPEGEKGATPLVMVSKKDLNTLIKAFMAAEFLLYEEISKNGEL